MPAGQTRPVHPGQVLLDEFLLPQRESMAQLARALGEPLSRITAVISGQAHVTEALAMKLAQHYGVAASFWLKLQTRFDRQAA